MCGMVQESGVKADHFSTAPPGCVPCMRSYLERKGRVEASKTSGSGKVCTKTKKYILKCNAYYYYYHQFILLM